MWAAASWTPSARDFRPMWASMTALPRLQA